MNNTAELGDATRDLLRDFLRQAHLLEMLYVLVREDYDRKNPSKTLQMALDSKAFNAIVPEAIRIGELCVGLHLPPVEHLAASSIADTVH
jgi:hypothetical protein